MGNGEQLVERWNAWLREMELHPLDQFDYLRALQVRDELGEWLQIRGDQRAMDEVDAIDHDYATLTTEDGRFAAQISSEAGGDWRWDRMPSNPAAQEYLLQDGLA